MSATFFAPRCGRVTAVEPSGLIDVLRANAAPFANIECVRQRIQDIAFNGEFTIALISGASKYDIPWGNIMAASVLVTLPLLVLVLVFQKKIVSGLTAGAVKG